MGTQINDNFLWLENIEDGKCLDWASEQNQLTLDKFASSEEYNSFLSKVKEILNDKRRIPNGLLVNGIFYNYWQDDEHPRGLWRSVAASEISQETPRWEILLDLDKLSEDEGKRWLFQQATFFTPDWDTCLVQLSDGGKDATIVREFNLKTKTFVEGGFAIEEEAKQWVEWYDRDTILVAGNFGEGSLTRSGYPRTVKKWRRGTRLEDAPVIFEGDEKDVLIWTKKNHSWLECPVVFYRWISFFEREYYLEGGDGRIHPLELPRDWKLCSIFNQGLVFLTRFDYTLDATQVPQGSIIYVPLKNNQISKNDLRVILSPQDKMVISAAYATRNYLMVQVLDNVQGKVIKFEVTDEKTWSSHTFDLPSFCQAVIRECDIYTDSALVVSTGFLTPSTLYLCECGHDKLVSLKQLPDYFDAQPFEVSQWDAKSDDGTSIPYFMISPKNMPLDGQRPTLVYGYGGFEVPLVPYYLSLEGRLWLEKGGAYVIANIRGGGEFGPSWHQAALMRGRHLAYEDFSSVLKDLIERKVTSPEHLGIMGGSNGGLLVGALMTKWPELMKAVVCTVPLLDMIRYPKLLAGASWMAEYGDPEREDIRDYWLRYSPYHQVSPDQKYPQALFMTSTRDDRVHPGHARKMVAKMKEQGHPVYYYENIEGGHAASSTTEQKAKFQALIYSYLWDKLRSPS